MTMLGELTDDVRLYGPDGFIDFDGIDMVVVKGMRSDMLFGST